jgi:hypothetical protein
MTIMSVNAIEGAILAEAATARRRAPTATATAAASAAAAAATTASATAAATTAAPCELLTTDTGRSGVFFIENVERSQADVSDFFLTEEEVVLQLCILRSGIRCRRARRRGCTTC